MAGRSGGQNSFSGVASEKEESDSPGTFTTSFDLLSIAKVIPAKQRRISNPSGFNEGQVADASAVGDWRKLPSAVTKEGPPNPDATKPMIFRRVAIPSSRLARHPPSIFASDGVNNTINKEPVTTGGTGASAWRNDGSSLFENKNMPSPMETLKSLRERDMKVSEPSQERHSATGYNLPGPDLPLSQQHQDIKDGWIADGDASDHGKRAPRGISSRTALLRAPEKIINPTTVFQTVEAAPPDSELDGSARFSRGSVPMIPVKSLNDSTAGTLRAVATPFEPKGGSSPGPAIPSEIQLQGSSSSAKIPLKLGSPSDPFGRFLDKIYEGSASPPTASPVSQSHRANVQKPSMIPVHWKLEESHHVSESGEQTMRMPKDGSSTPGTSRDTTHKQSSFGDAGISQLWNFPGSGSVSQPIGNEPPGLTGPGIVNFNPNAKAFAVPEAGSGSMSSPNKLCAGQIAVRDEAMEQIVPTPRKSLSSDLQIVERLEIRAMVLSESESDIVAAFLEEASINKHPQHSVAGENPVPQMDERGRRGAISMQGAVARTSDINDTSGDGRPKKLALEAQKNEEPVKARTRETWLEPNGEVEIRIMVEGSSEQTDQYWPYPYPRHDVSAEEITTQLFVELNEKLISYVQMNPDGTRLDNNWGRFKLRKGKSGYPPGQEPWFGGDNTSFFDMSFGVTPSYNVGKTTIKPPPGLSLTPMTHRQVAVEQMGTTQAEPGGLRDLVESSTPDYSHYNDDYKKLRARTLQEWNSTPISSTPMNPFSSHPVLSGQGGGVPFTGQLVYEDTRRQIGGNGGSINSPRESTMSKSTTLMKQSRPGTMFRADVTGIDANGSIIGPVNGNGNGWGADGQRDVGTPNGIGNETSERARRRRPEQIRDAFGVIGKFEPIVFGSDEESDGV